MSDLPEIKNEPNVGLSGGDLEDFSREYRSSQDQRYTRVDEPSKSRLRYLPTLLAILVLIVLGWHFIVANQLEERLNRSIEDSDAAHSQDFSASVNVNPLTDLVDLQIIRKVRRNDASNDFLEGMILELVRKGLEPWAERELSAAARRDNDLYAMMVPYQVSISIDKVRAPPGSPPSRMVQEIQRQLIARGYNPGSADGRLGERTRNAIEQFQRDHGVAVDGLATSELLEMLREQ